MTREEDQFQIWLMDMGDSIERFQRSLSGEQQPALDYSPESLDLVEKVALSMYPSSEEALRESEAIYVDSMARYVGQVFRKHLGGSWMIDFTDRKNAFYGLPQLTGMSGQEVQICPLTLVTTSLHRRTGRVLRTVLENSLRDAQML